MDISQHKYIKLLDYAISQKGSYHMEPALISAKISEREFEYVRDNFFICENMPSPPPNKNEVFDWKLKPEAVFSYLAYKQYEHAQNSSKIALYISTASFVVAAVTLVLSGSSLWL